MLDTGSSTSVIDLGTLKKIGLDENLNKQAAKSLINASGDKMKILGSVEIAVTLPGSQPRNQTFQVLDSITYSNILLGRDFMQTYGLLRLDFARNKTEMGAFSTPHLSTTNKQVRLGKPLPSLLDLKKN